MSTRRPEGGAPGRPARHARLRWHRLDSLALQFMGDTLDVLTIGDFAGSMYVLWGELTDWVELKPDEQGRAETEMVRAAREWLALDRRDSKGVARYFDYWLHDVCGHERP